MKRLRQDLNHLASAGLLAAVAATALTGVVAHLWDLNDFWYHTYSGYVMAAFALVHVLLNWGRLTGYARFRFSRRGAGRKKPAPAAAPVPRHRRVLRATGRTVVSRRGFLALVAGSAGGVLVGQKMGGAQPIAKGSDLGLLYHQWSKPGAMDLFGAVSNWGRKPPLYKTYEGAPKVALPKPRFDGGLSTEEAIIRRHSTREYSGEPMSLAELSRVLYMVDGISRERWGYKLRTAPSSGALYPVEIYPVVHNVSGLEPGIYHYGFREHALERLRADDMRDEVVRQGLSQQFLGKSNAVLFLTLIFQRMRFKYRDRTYRYGLIEAGHLGQNLYLAATSMGLGACAVGAFLDDQVNDMLGVDGKEEAAIYMLSVGRV